MKTHELLGQLSVLHQMMTHLLESVPEADGYRRFHPQLPPLAWLLGRAVYLECYWLREVVLQDDGMTARVRALLGHNAVASDEIVAALPPREHLLGWAHAAQEQNLTLLANPQHLPQHALVSKAHLLPLILQQRAALCEQMLSQLSERRLQQEEPYLVADPMCAQSPSTEHADIHKGHYRIGARDDVAALDSELPTQMVELHAFRIDRHPVSNGAFLGFLQGGGYSERAFWSEAGWQWRQQHQSQPHHWRQDARGAWYGIGLNGPFDLRPEDAASGLSLYEAEAYAQWVASQGGLLAGAVLQHEYQWEVAVRAEAFTDYGRVWEWCANPFHAYTGYQAPEDNEAASSGLDSGEHSLRGGCLHTQRIQRRSSYRHHLAPGERYGFSGARLVFPPSDMSWHKPAAK